MFKVLTGVASLTAIVASSVMPASAFVADQVTDSATIQAHLQVPYVCNIDLDSTYEIDLNNNIRGNYASLTSQSAFNVSQNGNTRWTLDQVQVLSAPLGANLVPNETAFRIENLGPGGDLTATLDSRGQKDVNGILDTAVNVRANIKETASAFLGGSEYRTETVLTCVSLEYLQNDIPQ